MALIAGIVALGVVWWLLTQYRKTDAKKMAPLLRKAGGIIAFIVAGVLLMRGRIDMALLAAGAGAWIYGELPFRLPFNLPFQNGPASGRISRARSATVEMTVDHDSGVIDGVVLAGPRAGTQLGLMPLPELVSLWRSCRQADPVGANLLEAYLDSRFSGWREHTDGDAHPGSARHGGGAGTITEKEAYEVLGLAPGAGPDDIRRAHRTLMKRLHPDQGGTNWLATRVNQAKDVLLARHR